MLIFYLKNNIGFEESFSMQEDLLFLVYVYRVATVREKILENENFSGQGKVREFHFQSGMYKKKMKKRKKKVIDK